jgi:hypothetical protein
MHERAADYNSDMKMPTLPDDENPTATATPEAPYRVAESQEILRQRAAETTPSAVSRQRQSGATRKKTHKHGASNAFQARRAGWEGVLHIAGRRAVE